VSDSESASTSRPLVVAALVFALAALLSAALIWRMELQRLQVERARVTDLAANHARALQISIERALTAAYSLAALVRLGNGTVTTFDAIVGGMLPYYPGASALELAPGGVITNVVPRAGNEKAIGFDLLKDPVQRQEAALARDTGKLTLAGPINLVQGGLGIAGRLPVFLDDGRGTAAFWGFTLVVLRFPGALVPARFDQLEERGFRYELWRTHPASGQRQVIDASSPTPLVEPVEYSLSLPNGAWTLSVSPARGWGDPSGLSLKGALGLTFSLILAFMAKLMVELKGHQQGLESLVARRTAEIQASEHKFSELLENMHLMAVIFDHEGTITFCNRYLLAQTGWSREEVIGQNWFGRFFPAADGLVAKGLFTEAMSGASLPAHREGPIKTRGGGQRIIVWDTTLLRGAAGEVVGAAGIGLDVTDHRDVEARLLQSQKMEAVGRLAGGIAHDFNNLLTPILGYSEMLRSTLAAGGGEVAQVELITEAALKARDLTRQLLSFGRKQTLDMRIIDLNEVVASFAAILRRTIRESIAIRLEPPTVPACIRADRTQIEQVVMNLVVNAQDAIADTGVVTIETESVVLDEEFVRSHPEARQGAFVMLTVRDTGGGIDEKALPHIFEPFFSTKEVGSGAGLGLATVFGIVQQHDGNIWVSSGPGRGTVFTIVFPRVAGVPSPSARTPAAALSQEQASGTILLVEDNQTVLTMVRSLLAGCGYTVIGTHDPLLALHLAADTRIDLLVTDVVMPGMNGPELYRRLLEARPGLKALFMSGYANGDVAQYLVLQEGVNFIQKPFPIGAMTSKVAAIISG
jgi:PAS domain S-box-containing protein